MVKNSKTSPAKRPQAVAVRSNVATVDDSHLEQMHAPSRLEASFALLFHTSDRTLSALTFHRIQQQRQGAMSIQPGRIMTPADEKRILDLLTRPAHAQALSILPESALQTGDDHALWWIPGGVRPMFLNTLDHGRTQVEAHWPNLVMLSTNRRLFLAAVADSTRPKQDTPLYHAPLGNVYASSELCLGDCRPPVNSGAESIQEWNAIVFDSAFSHSNHPAAMAGGSDVMAFWQKKRRKPVPVPLKSMTPMRLTLAEWFRQIMTGQVQ